MQVILQEMIEPSLNDSLFDDLSIMKWTSRNLGFQNQKSQVNNCLISESE